MIHIPAIVVRESALESSILTAAAEYWLSRLQNYTFMRAVHNSYEKNVPDQQSIVGAAQGKPAHNDP